MNKTAIKNIKATFEGNPKVDTFFHNEHGHCFKNGAEGLTAITRAEAEKLTEVKEEVEAPEGGTTSEPKKGGKKK
jgi:hypothetical protein